MMLFNKRNRVLETFAAIFLVKIKYFKTPQLLTSEANEYTYGNWRNVLREFNIAQVIEIEENRHNYVNPVFEGNLSTYRSRN